MPKLKAAADIVEQITCRNMIEQRSTHAREQMRVASDSYEDYEKVVLENQTCIFL